MPAGRPIGTVKTLTDEEKKQIEKLAAFLNKKQLAGYFGMCENTLSRIMEDEPELFEAYEKGKSKAVAMVGNSLLMQARDGNMTAAIFYLKTQAGWKESQEIELTGKDGADLPVITVNFVKPE